MNAEVKHSINIEKMMMVFIWGTRTEGSWDIDRDTDPSPWHVLCLRRAEATALETKAIYLFANITDDPVIEDMGRLTDSCTGVLPQGSFRRPAVLCCAETAHSSCGVVGVKCIILLGLEWTGH